MRKYDSSGFVLVIALLVGFTLFSACADLVQIAVQGMRIHEEKRSCFRSGRN